MRNSLGKQIDISIIMFTLLFVMKTIQFPRWAEVLGASELPQKDRDSYRVKGFASRGF